MTPAAFSAFDWVLAAVLGYSAIRAFLRGFLLEVFSLAGLVAGLLLASWNYRLLGSLVGTWMRSIPAAQVFSFMLIAILVMIVCHVMGRFLRAGASTVGLGVFDRLLGGVFGLARGYLLGAVLVAAFAAFGPQPGWITNSQLAPYFLAGAHGVSFVVPHDLEQQVTNGAIEFKHKAPVWIKLPQ